MFKFVNGEKRLFILIFVLSLTQYSTQDVVACGGFVKSDITINYSLVEIKLYTKQGVLKYQTDCAPHNGYYLIPLYDKGDYILKVDPPFGWTFEPSSIELRVDGRTDPCSRGEDNNFIFKGFLITGKVLSSGRNEGPSGIIISLKDKSTNQVIRTTETTEGGVYNIEALLPGDYNVEATHDLWTLKDSKFSLAVVDNVVNIKHNVIVLGYDVRGRVISDNDPIKGVHFVLYSNEIKPNRVHGCDKSTLRGFVSAKTDIMLCHVTSESDGSFVFPTLPSGSYKLLPFYKGENIKFDVMPSHIDFQVHHDSVVLPELFKVQGFSVSGRVLAEAGGGGVAQVVVTVTSEGETYMEPHTTLTKSDGIFHLDSMKAGMYRISASYPSGDITFQPLVIKITPNTPLLPDILASGFKVCGKIIIERIASENQVGLFVNVESSAAGGTNRLTVDRSREFCTVLKPGKYTLKPVVDGGSATLKFKPAERVITVVDGPVLDLKFKQFLATASGVISCLSDCPDIELTIKSAEDRTIDRTVAKNGRFSFNKLVPGDYEITVDDENWCWKEKSIKARVTTSDVGAIKFVQEGYLMTLWTSHDAIVFYNLKQKKPVEFKLNRGTNSRCVVESGVYIMKISSCHEFGEESRQFDTSKPTVITFTAMKHHVTGKVISGSKIDDIKLNLFYPDGNKQVTSVIAEETKSKQFEYRFKFSAYPNQVIKVTPSSKKLLFYPQDAEVLTVDDCLNDAVTFEGREGLFINGVVKPPLAGVKITVRAVDGSRNPVLLETEKNGLYNLGPLDSATKYTVDAEKSGYMLKAVDGKLGHFDAFKLAEIKVNIIDEKNVLLSGVLLSLSGTNNHRQNNITDDGTMTFSDLVPGQYFLRPMMKEFKFDPPSKMFDVSEGSSLTFNIRAFRTAYSCFGAVMSLTGESEPGIALEAIGLKTVSDIKESDCGQEDGVSEQDGSFRIRGLQPGCEYKLQLKQGEDVNRHIERSSPKYKFIKIDNDHKTDVRLIVFRHFQQMDVTANIATPAEHLSTLKLRLYKEDNPDQAISTISLSQSSFVQLPSLPLDNKMYILRLETSLPRSTYEINSQSMPEISFKANTSYRHLVIQFNPKPKLMDNDALGQGTLFALPLTIIVIIVAYNYSKIVPVLNRGNVVLQNLINQSSRISENASIVDSSNRRKLKVRKT